MAETKPAIADNSIFLTTGVCSCQFYMDFVGNDWPERWPTSSRLAASMEEMGGIL